MSLSRLRFVSMTLGLLWMASPVAADSADLLSAAIEDYQRQDLDAARQKLNEVLRIDPDSLYAHYYVGVVLYQQGGMREAIPHLERVSRSSDPVPGVEAILAGAYLAAGDASKALPYFKMAAESNPADEGMTYQYAASLQGVGKSKEAGKIFRRIARARGKYADAASYQLGAILAREGSPVAATRYFRSIGPESPYAEAAKSYLDSLAPLTRPFSTYISIDSFYNDNPGSASADRIPGSRVAGGSFGITVTGVANSRGFELSRRSKARLSYMFYGSFYREALARDNNFAGHFINPAIGFRITPSIALELKGDIQFFRFAQQELSTNLGAVLTATWTNPSGQSLNAHVGFTRKLYTDDYRGRDAPSTSLQYLNAKTLSTGLGATLVVPKWGASLRADYTFSDELTDSWSNPHLQIQSSDSRYLEHALRADATIPLVGPLSRFSVLGSVSYSFKDYLERQSGQVYPSATGRYITVGLLTLGARVQIMLWKRFGVAFSGGIERSTSHSRAVEATYESNKYYGQISASY